MDKGMANIQEIQKYFETKANVNHMSNFKYVNGKLVITGTHNDDPSVRYRVTLR